MGQIIKLNTNSNSKDFNREKFEISIKKEIEIKKQNECKHIEIEVDSDEDLHNCLECGKKFTAHEYLVFKALDNSRIKFHSYTLKNDIHFLEQEKVQLENYVNDLKSQKHKLSSWITRTKKQNDIKNNDWNAGVLGYDTSGQPIVPVRDKLVVKENAHPNCDGTAWGWIEGCSLHICWSDENTRFNREKADELIRQYNTR